MGTFTVHQSAGKEEMMRLYVTRWGEREATKGQRGHKLFTVWFISS
jgi:hypothetical protein